jgi:ribosomal protein S18 acetylase RimI-like enzyme
MDIRIVESRDKDLLARLNEEVQTLHAEMHPDLFRPYIKEQAAALFEWALQQPSYHHFIALAEDLPVGYMQIEQRQYGNVLRRDLQVIYIHHMCVVKTHQHRGIGRLLLDHARAFAQAQGIRRMELDIWSRNIRAKQAFQKYGFAPYNERMYVEWDGESS